ncbi:hypothetical protein SHIRM173S_12783 [Streptomyces hirsutus]
MCMHHELSYTLETPGLMLFACLTAPDQGGATAVADAVQILQALPAEPRERFAREGWLLTRSYNDEIGASLEESFGTGDRAEIERYCRAGAIDFTWQPDGSLRTTQRRPAVVRHPLTGKDCWFNQIAFLNEWTLDPEVREYLVDAYGDDGMPFNTRFGDGSPIGEDIVQLLTRPTKSTPDASPGRPVTCCSSTTSAPRTAESPSPESGRCWSAWPSPTDRPTATRPRRRAGDDQPVVHPHAAGHARHGFGADVRGDLR